MARTPVRIQSGAYGTDNPASSTASYGSRAMPQPSVLQRGPSQGREQFSSAGLADSASVARALNQIQANVDTAMGPSKNNPFADGNLIEGVVFNSSATTPIKHGLGGPARGYVIMNADANAATHRVAQTPISLEAQTILIYSNLGFKGDIWVYK